MLRPRVNRQALALALSAALLAALTGCGAGKKSEAPTPPPQTPPTQSTSTPPETQPAPAPEPPPPPPTRPAAQLPGAVGVMIENSYQARPQVGLDKADVVYEMEAEYGITRFLALFYQEKVAKIGPVRSARMGFYDVATAYGVPYAHAGGSNEVLLELDRRNTRLLNLDEIYTCGACFWRVREREAPHNLYTSTDLIVGRANEVGFKLNPIYRFPEGEKMAGGTVVEKIAFHWGPGNQDVSWSWNGKRYERSQSGEKHVLEDGTQIATDNLILLFTKYVWDGNAQPNSGLNRIQIIGSGEGYLYRNGQAYPIKWTKSARDQHYSFTFPTGEPVNLTMGQTWVEILKSKDHLAEGAIK